MKFLYRVLLFSCLGLPCTTLAQQDFMFRNEDLSYQIGLDCSKETLTAKLHVNNLTDSIIIYPSLTHTGIDLMDGRIYISIGWNQLNAVNVPLKFKAILPKDSLVLQLDIPIATLKSNNMYVNFNYLVKTDNSSKEGIGWGNYELDLSDFMKQMVWHEQVYSIHLTSAK